jgi:ribosomal peptide maturation radical SAM protein 1
MLLDTFTCIDAICTGEGEPCIVDLALASTTANTDLSVVPNLMFRDHARKVVTSAQAKPVDMDKVPAPDFDDFYAEVEELSAEYEVDIAVDRLPVENSRGCWWGATHHCVFCGIHDDDLAYRARSADSVLHMLATLSERYNCREFRFADYILPHTYYATLLPKLIERDTPYRLKCELKANINEQRLRLLVDAGFVEVQPGVESFSSKVLKSMDKGVSGVQNVYLLLLARRHGITILYNILYGLPDDDPDDVEAMARALPNLTHLDPPSTRGRIQVTRYAPLQANPCRFGFGALRHERAYDLIFSKSYLASSGFDLDRYCYMFELPFEPSPKLARAYREIERVCDAWTEDDRRRPIDLLYETDEVGDFVVHDSRRQPSQIYTLTPDEASLLVAAEIPRTRGELLSLLKATADQIEERLQALAARGLIFEDGGKLVSLALPRQHVSARRHWWDNYKSRWRRPAEMESNEEPAVIAT